MTTPPPDNPPEHEWEPPSLPNQSAVDLPPFPCNVLPPVLGDYAQAIAVATQTPAGWAAVCTLAAVATAGQRRYLVQPLESSGPSPLSLYATIVGSPSTGKTPVLGAMRAPLDERQAYLRERWATQERDAAPLLRAAERRLTNAEKALAVASDEQRPEAIIAVRDAAAEVQRLTSPPQPRLIVDDISPERLAEQIAEQGGALAIWSPEGSALEVAMGRYNANGKASIEHYLSAYDGETIVVDRMQRGLTVKCPTLTWAASMQPIVLQSVVSDPLLQGRGLVARMLYCVEPDLLGRRDPDPPPVAESIRGAYHSAILDLLGDDEREADGSLRRQVLRFDSRARQAVITARRTCEPELADDGPARGWLGRQVARTTRIAAGFAALRGASVVTAADFDAAMEIKRWSDAHGRHVLEPLPIERPEVRALLRRIVAGDIVDGMTLKSIYDRGWSGLNRDGLGRAIEIAMPLHWVRVDRRKTGGRPSDIICINPALRRGATG